MTTLYELPDEVKLHFMSNLAPKDIAALAKVCRNFDELAKDEPLWKHLLLRDYPVKLLVKGINKWSSFKQAYRLSHEEEYSPLSAEQKILMHILKENQYDSVTLTRNGYAGILEFKDHLYKSLFVKIKEGFPFLELLCQSNNQALKDSICARFRNNCHNRVHGVDVPNTNNLSFIHMLVLMNQPVALQQRLKEDCADIDIKTKDGYTALLYAANYGNLKMLKLLIEYNASLGERENIHSNNALLLAVTSGSIDCVKYLLEECALDPNVDNGTADAIVYTILMDRLDLMDYIFEQNKTFDKKYLVLATKLGRTEIVDYLVKRFNVDWNFDDCLAVALSPDDVVYTATVADDEWAGDSYQSDSEETFVTEDEWVSDSSQPDSEETFKANILNATQAYLKWMDENATGHRLLGRFSHFYHGNSGRARVQTILEMINRKESCNDILQHVEIAFRASGNKNHSYSRYLVDAMEGAKEGVTTVNNSEISAKHFKRIKNNFDFHQSPDVSKPSPT